MNSATISCAYCCTTADLPTPGWPWTKGLEFGLVAVAQDGAQLRGGDFDVLHGWPISSAAPGDCPAENGFRAMHIIPPTTTA